MAYGTVNAEQMTTQSGYTLGAGNASSFKNRIYNGNMVIDQRNAGAAVTAGSAYTLDRWNVDRVWAGSTVTIQQTSTAPSGFTNSLAATVSTGAAVAAGSYFSIQQFLEGYNIADMALGTASAKQFTVSFWVRSSVTGAFGVGFRNSAFDLSYWTTYTINAANTWEQKSVTIAAPTSGTFATGNSYGLNAIFSLGCGSTNKAVSNDAWNAGGKLGAVGETDLIATTGATFYITGVQLEVGTVATSFDYRPYGTELNLCQRYFYSMGGGGTYEQFFFVSSTAATDGRSIMYTPTPMRTVPSILQSGSFQIAGGSTSLTGTYSAGTTMYAQNPATFAGVQNIGFDFWPGTAGSYGVTNAGCFIVRANGSTATRFQLSAEL
jgi:hypothetical protein